MKEKILAVLILGIGAIGLIAILALVASIPVWLIWNWIMPELFGLKSITFLQAVGLSILSALLFNSSSTLKSK